MTRYETHGDIYRQQYRRFSRMKVPPCSLCGSKDTASVQVGVVGITIRLAATCQKFKLIPNGPPKGEWFCNHCEKFFDVIKKKTQTKKRPS